MASETETPGGETKLSREIERKYLLRSLPERALTGRRITMEQGYLPGEKIHERVRRETSAEGVRHRRTIKLGRGLERIEVEETIDAQLFAGLFALTEGRRVQKVRYLVDEGEFTFEIDAFTDRDLHLAEVELASVDQQVVLPPWLAEVVVREVTDEPAYLNLNLAR